VTQWGFFVRADGYWFLPFLWAHGGRLLDPRRREVYVNQRRAVAALAYYRDLIHEHHVAPPRPSPSNDYEEQMRMFGAGEVAMIVNGPWATSDLLGRPAFEKPERLGVAPFPRGDSVRNPAPLSGHGFVVSRCAKDPAAAWRLARALSDRAAQIAFAQANSLIPTLRKAYEDPRVEASSFVVSFREALARARPRPRHPAVARIFDDFTPAVQAVLLGDATPQEALDGVARAWRRLVGPAKQPTTAPAAGGR
jgi:arabinogalactan oligomer/maltooligosaccharide transport system substrate-binding protein